MSVCGTVRCVSPLFFLPPTAVAENANGGVHWNALPLHSTTPLHFDTNPAWLKERKRSRMNIHGRRVRVHCCPLGALSGMLGVWCLVLCCAASASNQHGPWSYRMFTVNPSPMSQI
ncbi:hypothetical protein BU24DRAFT_39609 [Aaosphaeria arxii CBS 175.79]|uniref:Uncharacterized protein n=1 Tax=Aaosphaeria arxii CBS 175.79 TaxID=1450172 RepID=A0A6A5YB12_9PLEO|nr:uncharacterized protein BU24DRAFT_39609 [Aaosphaeria arxii CBS 175.79]KAF2022217.1 hypothetical protein BU24DRAFT_39609 [Aaosphaeria arxii CBS 175.79]